MRKILIVFICLLSVAFSNAEQLTSFSTEHDKFMKELDQHLTAGKLEANVKIMEQFSKLVKEGKISSGWLDKIIITSNLMLERSMAGYPHFNDYLTAVINAVKRKNGCPV